MDRRFYQAAIVSLVFAWKIVNAGIAICVSAQGPAPSELSVPQILERHCQSCHNGALKQGKLDLTSREALLRGGENGPAIIPGNAKASLLYQLVSHEQEPAMPYKADKLPGDIIARIAAWIDAGAPFDSSAPGANAVNRVNGISAVNAGKSSADTKIFAEKVRPVLETQCVACHGGKLKQAGLNLITRELLLRGSDNGPVIVPGDAKASLLVKKIKHEHDPGMPYKGQKLSDEVIAQIVAWVDAGAPYDQPLNKEASLQQTSSASPGGDHWAFKLPLRARIPVVKDKGWVRNPVDAFIAAEQEKHGLKPVPAAEKQVLLRRVYLDLIGLPPTPDEMQAFLADHSSNAYEKVVDRLLESPRYGERWGRHWMDIWRYSDWYGFGDEVRNSQPQIWRWRDWIIESLNQDKSYDQMVLEMLAGDEIAPNDPQTLRATGFLARNWYRFNRNVWMQDLVEHTSAGFLAVTLKCARCHDHKFDPIAQEEYYRFRAFFEPYDVRMDRVPGQPDLRESHGILTNGLPRAYDADPREATTVTPFLPAIFRETYRFVRGDEKNPDREHPLAPGVPEILGNHNIQIQPVTLPVEAAYPDLRPFVHQDLLAQARTQIERSKSSVAKANQELMQARERLSGVTPREREFSGQGVSAASPTSASAPSPSETVSASSSLASGLPVINFENEIKPVLEKNCFSCHNSNNDKSGLSLETVESILQGGNINGPAVISRKSAESPLIQYLRGEKTPRMPFGGSALPGQQIALIAKWIDQLPEEEPQLALQKAEAALALAEKELASARASLPALEARIAADKAKYAEPPDPKAEELSQSARKAERQANLLKGEENLLRAQQKLAEALRVMNPADDKAEKARDKKVEAARKQLDAAVAALAQPGDSYTPIGKLYPRSSTGRRLALARWIANKQNPLTARVAVNHIWLRHFGKALVPTVFNFGHNGRPPTHPELLDWLANEFMDKNWSMKSLHRLLVTSNTYRMASSAPDANSPNLSADPQNRYYWRMNPRRMEAEVVRDSLLQVAGELDFTQGGPEIDEKTGQTSRRRSVYFRHTPDAQMTFLKLFDAANPADCYERNESVAPQQALALSNSPLSYSQARLLASKISKKPASGSAESDFIVAAFQSILGRPPSAQELSESVSFVREQGELFRSPEKLTAFRAGQVGEVPPAADPLARAREDFVHALFNHNDFVTIR